jgi:CDP-4-dehydro-6-deoxyglucose reductase
VSGQLNKLVHKLTLKTINELGPKYYELNCSEDETIYATAKAQGFRLPVSCLNGVCHVCRGNLLSGSVFTGVTKKIINQQFEKCVSTEVMLCQTWPKGQSEIEVRHLFGPGELPVKKVKCQVLSVERLKGHIYQVDFQLPAGKQPEFFPGQYLALQLPGKEEANYFSLACRPGLRVLSLHIQADPHLVSAVDVITHLELCVEQGLSANLSLPYGEACLTTIPNKPLVLVAAGTGFAQMKSMIEYLFEHQFNFPISLYWGVKKEEDMYLKSLAESWAQEHENFKFMPVFSDIEKIDLKDHHNQLSDAVLAEDNKLLDSMVFVSGSPKLVFSAMDAFMDAGLPENQFFSDVLAYAVRES